MELNECHSIEELLEKCEIRIPIIQRDYAHGRKSKDATTVRERLIKDMVSNIISNKKLDFNFVYGNIKEENVDIFYPVDGQQRLTTTYLFYWYIACKCGKWNDESFGKLHKFSYATRSSAAEFFTLLKSPTEEQRRDLILLVKDGTLSKMKVKDFNWFSHNWLNDPTVNSAINILEGIQKAFLNEEIVDYEGIYNGGLSSIYFTVLPEEGKNAETAAAIKYIRMNARGKVLTSFENVKAMLDGIEKKLDEATNFIYEYDVHFIDIFYDIAKAYANEKLEDKTKEIDLLTMNFLINSFNIACKIKNKQFDGDFIEIMYNNSQNIELDNDFFEFYFRMIIAILSFRYENKNNEDAKKYVDVVFSEEYDEKEYTAYFLYLYHLYMVSYKEFNEKHKKSNNTDEDEFDYLEILRNEEIVEKLNKHKYVLDNLKYDTWDDKAYCCIDKFSEAIAEKADVSDYFITTKIDDILKNIASVGLEDIRIRIKEQKIKFQVIKSLGEEYSYFKNLEERFPQKKIQYLLYISNLWDEKLTYAIINLNQKLLKDNYVVADLFFFETMPSKNNLDWRKLFAIGGNWDAINNNNYQDINKDTTNNWGIIDYWDDKSYFWNDAEDNQGSIEDHVKDKLDIVKRAYESYSNNNNIIKDIEANIPDDIWLKYALKYDYDYLLTNSISMDNINGLQIEVNERNYSPTKAKKQFMHMVLLLKLLGGQDYKIYSSDQNIFDLQEVNDFGGFGKCIFSMKWIESTISLYAQKPNGTYGKWDTYWNVNTVNLRLYGKVLNNIAQPYGEIYLIDRKNKKYKIFRQAKQCNQYDVLEVDLNAIGNEIYKEANLIKQNLDSYTNTDVNMLNDLYNSKDKSGGSLIYEGGRYNFCQFKSINSGQKFVICPQETI